MISKKALLQRCKLYIIGDKYTCGNIQTLFKKIKSAQPHAPFVIQLRDKRTNKTKEIFKEALKLKEALESNTILIINDHLDIAMAVDADGVHLGQDDLPVSIARKLWGKNKIIGVSCHSLKQALKAQKEGADYIGIGPIFPTPTKPEYKAIGTAVLKQLKKKLRIPFFAIGSIDESNLNKIMAAGAKRVAVCRAVCKAEDVAAAFKRIIRQLNNNDTIRICS